MAESCAELRKRGTASKGVSIPHRSPSLYGDYAYGQEPRARYKQKIKEGAYFPRPPKNATEACSVPWKEAQNHFDHGFAFSIAIVKIDS